MANVFSTKAAPRWLTNNRESLLAFALGVFLVSLFQTKMFVPDAPLSQGALFSRRASTRDVHVSSMCRCGNNLIPVPGFNVRTEQNFPITATAGHSTGIVQASSKAIGDRPKRFIHHKIKKCQCINVKWGAPTNDASLSRLSKQNFERQCPYNQISTRWDRMPDLGVEELPIFAGILSYEAPLSLQNTALNWIDQDLFHRIGAKDVFLQLNHRSDQDNEVVEEIQATLKAKRRHPFTVMGSEEENIGPGLAISKFCRAAEEHPDSHPNGENLLLFLEKDWTLYVREDLKETRYLENLFRSANALMQRGVNYVRVKPRVGGLPEEQFWNCPSQGVPWICTTSHHHRWTNQPFIVRCDWFLRYLEPYALMSLNDPIMRVCRQSLQGSSYCDWEEAMQDGRVAWTNSNWIMATMAVGQMNFVHHEVDQ